MEVGMYPVHHTPSGGMSMCRVGDILLIVTRRGGFDERDWRGHVAILAEDAARNGHAPAGLTYSIGVRGPTLAQRRYLRSVIPKDQAFARMAVVSDSLVARASVASVRWILRAGTDLRAFEPGLERTALAWALGPTASITEAANQLDAMLQAMGYPPSQ